MAQSVSGKMISGKITMKRLHVIGLLLLGYFHTTILPTLGQSASPDSSMALVEAKIYPSPAEQQIADGVVIIKNGKITAVGAKDKIKIPQDAKIMNCAGLTLTAGFWNCHVHFIERKWANAATIPSAELTQQLQNILTRYGFVYVFDTGSVLENTKIIQQRVETGEVAGPRIYTTGMILFPKGGAPLPIVIAALGFMPAETPEIETTEQGIEKIQQRLNGGAEAVKIYAETWAGPPVSMSLEVVKGITEETHRRGKLVLAHPSGSTGLERAIDAGVDVLVHTAPNSGVWSEALVARMKQKKIALIPTLKLWMHETRHDRASLVQRFIDGGIEQLRTYAKSGGTILFGTDVGYMDDYEPTEEYVLMSKAGLKYEQILASLTTSPAERFGAANHTGKIAVGMNADLVLLDGDPATDIKAFSKVRCTMRQGKIIYQSM